MSKKPNPFPKVLRKQIFSLTQDIDFRYIISVFLIWRIFLFILLEFAISFVLLQKNFLGGGLANYLSLPQLWAWVNFDGEHYLEIARVGYKPLTYFFFPFYPGLVSFIAGIFGSSLKSYAVSGLLISHASFILGLVGLWKLARIDFNKRITKLIILTLVTFPTSFYFASFYTESLFFALVVWGFYFARSKRWLLAFFLAGLSSATRVVGVVVALAFAWDYVVENKVFDSKRDVNMANAIKAMLLLLLGIYGLLFYLVYLNEVVGDPLEFFNSVSVFGEQRSSAIILLPRVFYRYMFKILPNVNYNYFPIVFTTLLELVSAILFLFLSIYAFFRLRISYVIYLALGYLIPTLSGSFSSLPRYVLVLFPAFFIIVKELSKKSKSLKFLYFFISTILLTISTALFLRGYWLS